MRQRDSETVRQQSSEAEPSPDSRGQNKLWLPKVTQHTQRKHCNNKTATAHPCERGLALPPASTHPPCPLTQQLHTALRSSIHSTRQPYSHVVQPVSHGRAGSVRLRPRSPGVACPPGVCAAHHRAPHTRLVHPGCSMGLDNGTACVHGLTHIHSPSLSPSHT